MAFLGPVGPIVDKLVEKGSDFIPIIGPGLRYVRTAQNVTKFANPIRATTYTSGLLLEICGGKTAKYSVLCSVWATSTILGVATSNPALLAVGMEAGNEILEDFYS